MNEQTKRLIKLIKYCILPIISLLTIIIAALSGHPVKCKFHTITGLYCPGCGITRMIFSLLKGNIEQAFFYNPLAFILSPVIIIYCIINGYQYIRYGTLPQFPKITALIILIITIIFGILRNVPSFSILAP